MVAGGRRRGGVRGRFELLLFQNGKARRARVADEERAERCVRERVLRAATAASNERLLDDDDDGDDDDDARPAVVGRLRLARPAPTVEDETEADLADSLRDDDHLVRALLRGGTDGERAAEILASRLRASVSSRMKHLRDVSRA